MVVQLVIASTMYTYQWEDKDIAPSAVGRAAIWTTPTNDGAWLGTVDFAHHVDVQHHSGGSSSACRNNGRPV